MKMEAKRSVALLLSGLVLSSCSFNPFSSNNHLTGDPAVTLIGAGAGAGTVAALGGSNTAIALGGIGGGLIGYYATTLRYTAGGLMQYGGQVYQVGQYIGIYIPSDQLFLPNSTDFKPQAMSILDSAAAVLSRFPSNNILVSGNTSGFADEDWELKLSERRAERVSAYFWKNGVGSDTYLSGTMEMRKYRYVGYGDYFPIATKRYNTGLRQNSRIQITSYPNDADLRSVNSDSGEIRDMNDCGKDAC